MKKLKRRRIIYIFSKNGSNYTKHIKKDQNYPSPKSWVDSKENNKKKNTPLLYFALKRAKLHEVCGSFMNSVSLKVRRRFWNLNSFIFMAEYRACYVQKYEYVFENGYRKSAH